MKRFRVFLRSFKHFSSGDDLEIVRDFEVWASSPVTAEFRAIDRAYQLYGHRSWVRVKLEAIPDQSMSFAL